MPACDATHRARAPPALPGQRRPRPRSRASLRFGRPWHGEATARFVGRETAGIPPPRPSRKRTKESAATRLATPMTSEATPSPFRGRATTDVGGGGVYDGCAALI